MFSLYRTLSLRYLSRRWFRALLVVASIMLGVGTLIATQALSETMSKATLASGNPMAGTIDFIVTNGDFPIDRDLTKDLEKIAGIREVQAKIFEKADILVGDKTIQIMVMGYDLRGDAEKKTGGFEEQFELSSDTKVVQASFATVDFLGEIPAILGEQLDKDLENEPITGALGYKRLHIKCGPETHKVTSIASVKPKEKSSLAAFGGYVVILDLEHAANVVGLKRGKVRRIDIALHAGADPKKLRRDIESIVKGRAEVLTLEEQNQSLQSPSIGMKTGFSMCGVAALIVGMFLVYNSLSVSVAERRHEIGILLSLGATRDQVWRLFAGEAFILGVVGSSLGIPLGWGLAYIGLGPMQDAIGDVFATMNLKQVELSWELIALAFGVGILSAVVASLVPAIQAAQEKPAEAVRRIPKEPPVSHLVAHVCAVGALILGGMAMIVLRDLIPKRWGIFGGLSLVMIGALLAAPLFAQLAARAVMPISRRFFPIEWRIAADNLIRAPGRTGMVIGALTAGVCLIVETAGIIRSNREVIREWLDASMACEIIVTSGSPVGSGGQNKPMKEILEKDLRAIEGVEDAVPSRQSYNILFRGSQICLTTVVADRALKLEPDRLKKHDHLKLYQALESEANAIIVSHNFAALHHVRKGDHITLKSPQGEVKLHVVGEVQDFTWPLGTIVMNRKDYLRHWNDHDVTIFEVYLKPGVDAEDAKIRIAKKLGAQHDLHAETRTELMKRVDIVIERMYHIALGQEIVVILVAALGVVTALLISVLQRKREMGLLRAIGASRAQVIYLVLAEACLMGIFGSILGVILAFPLQWYTLQIVFPEETGYSFAVHFPWVGSVLVAIFALIIATLAGLGPAMYAVRERIPDAIAYE